MDWDNKGHRGSTVEWIGTIRGTEVVQWSGLGQ